MKLLSVGTDVRIVGSQMAGKIAGYGQMERQLGPYNNAEGMQAVYLIDIGEARWIESRQMTISIIVCDTGNVQELYSGDGPTF